MGCTKESMRSADAVLPLLRGYLRICTPLMVVHGAADRGGGSISTVAVMPATSRTPSGTLSMSIRTGTRWARRTQVKMGLTGGEPGLIRLRIRDIDGTRDAADMAGDDLAVAHQLDLRGIALLDRGKIAFLEIPVHPKGIGVDQSDFVLSDIHIVAELSPQIRDPSVDGGTDLGAIELTRACSRLARAC